MNNIFLTVLTLLISGTEPFLGQFSAVVVWSAVLGVKKQDIAGVMLVFLSGLIRDVLLVNRLGQSSIILMVVWASAAIITSKLSRNLFSAAISAPAGYLVMTLLETGRLNIFGAAITSVISLLAIAIWTWKDSRGSGIKVRLSS